MFFSRVSSVLTQRPESIKALDLISLSPLLFSAMAKSPLIALRIVFLTLGCVMVATLIYTISIDGLPFRKDLLTPWMIALLIDFYIHIAVLAAWVSYKETSWLSAVIWIVLLVCLGSITTCAYIAIQLFKLSNEESMQDLMCHLLLKKLNKNTATQRSNSYQIVTARIIFSVLGCLMLATLIYTILSAGSPFNKDNFIPWVNATLIDFYINVTALAVWISYKESSWIGRIIWIALIICFGSIATCAFIVRELFILSPYDPLYIVLLNKKDRQVSSF
ncbi:hypothetical protein V2J09_024228 [Rumex salicifolius]